jgi:predicted LPLAT superfamily acyltransferase
MYKICALIPTYNHHQVLSKIVSRLLEVGLDIFIVDDGSNEETKKALAALTNNHSSIHLQHLPENRGKGAAIQAGLEWVANTGYTHAFQLDADGQHSLENLEAFLQLSKKNPHALLSGKPIYDASIPLSRKIGRWITHVWVWIETLSFRITDSMCGFRIYPVHQTLAITQQKNIGRRMDFDTDIMVRLFWQGTPVIMSPVRVTYPLGNLSHFHPIKDNWRITKMHTRLFFGMLINLPKRLFKPRNDIPVSLTSWATLQEKGTFLGLFILALSYRLLGRRLCLIIGAPIVGYFYFTSPEQRRASQNFLQKIAAHKKIEKKPGIAEGLKHYMRFFDATLDKFAAWTGRMDWKKIESTSLANFKKIISTDKGGMLLVSHLGNMEFCRAVSSENNKHRIHVLLHSKNAQHFNRLLKTFSPDAKISVLEVSEVSPGTMIYLKERVDAGDWVVIAADRVPISANARVTHATFLGETAPFSQGPYVLAALLQCPVYTALAVKESGIFKMYVDLFAEKVTLDRKTRDADIQRYAQQYAKYLEKYSLMYPYQWFNFFNFWK